MASGQTSAEQTSVDLIAGATPGAWSVELTEADTGTLEDAALWHGDGLPGILSLCPEHVFTKAD